MVEDREAKRREAVDEWGRTPAANPRYKGATPNEVGRALLEKGKPDKGRKFKSPV